MEKTEMMKRYEAETAKQSTRFVTDGIHSAGIEVWRYDRLIEAKAEAYDELMQRQVTRKELANITNHPVAVSEDCTEFVVFSSKPELEDFCCGEEEGDHLRWIGERLFSITLRDQYDGCWWTSLTLPDGWEDAK